MSRIPVLSCLSLFNRLHASSQGTPSQVSIRLSHSQKLLPEASLSMGSLFSGTHGTGWISWSSQWRKYYQSQLLMREAFVIENTELH